MMRNKSSLSVDDLRPPLQKLSNGSVSLHQQRHGVSERPVPHYGQWFCKFFPEPKMSYPSFSTPQYIFNEWQLSAGLTSVL